jgi:hypothetical protein
MGTNYAGNNRKLRQICGFNKPVTLTRQNRARYTVNVANAHQPIR